jgi:FKBP-type peptidyl-prolyl cis-trans isomerase
MDKSSTTKSQKIVIWVILIFMTVGSIGAYFVTIIANNNANDKELQQQDQERLMREYQDQIKKQQEAEAKKKKEPLDGYEATAFDKANVTELQTEIVKEGEGKEATADSTVEADYFGWTSDGKIFDSSKKDGVTTSASFSLKSVIKGWTEGLTGKKEGSVVKLTIPADKAYGETGSPPNIGANEPLMFIVILKKVQ